MRKSTLIALACISMFTSAHAASFNCEKASSALEKTICNDPEISLFDEALAKSYIDAIGKLSSDGKIILHDGQRRWLHYITNVCFIYKNDKNARDCTKKMYQDRIKDLGTAAQQIGPFVFSRIDYFYSKNDDEFGRPFQGETSYPRIDSPLSENAKKWNAIMADKSKAEGDSWCDGSPGDINIGFEIKSATESIISSQRSNWMYCHRAAHGYGGTMGVTYVLVPTPHLLVASDLFYPDKSWENLLTEKSIDELERKAATTEINRQQVVSIITNPKSWSLTKEGLVITFNPYEVLAYVFGTTEVTIPWTELRPFLVPAAPVPVSE